MTAAHVLLLIALVGVVATGLAFVALALTIVGGMVRASASRPGR
jgi:hypothetical protein